MEWAVRLTLRAAFPLKMNWLVDGGCRQMTRVPSRLRMKGWEDVVTTQSEVDVAVARGTNEVKRRGT